MNKANVDITTALQPAATCRQSPYLHKPAIVIMTSFSLWWRHSLLCWLPPVLRKNVRTLHTDTLPRLVYKDHISPGMCCKLPSSPFWLRSEFCWFLFALPWHTEWSLLLHDVISDLMIPFASNAASYCQCFRIARTAPENCPFPLGDLHLHVIYSCLNPPESSSKMACRSVEPFLYGYKMLRCTMYCQWREDLQNCPLPLGILSPCRERTEPQP